MERKIKKRYFKDSKSYFNFINKKKKFINVLFVKPLKNRIRVDFEMKPSEEVEPEQIEMFKEERKVNYV